MCSFPHASVRDACGLGLTFGLLDIITSGLGLLVPAIYLAVGPRLGWRNPGRSFWAWLILGGSLYPIHLAAIALGRESPFVESSYLGASQNLIYV